MTTYVWTWRHRTINLTAYGGIGTIKVPWFGDGVDRCGQACRVIACGTMNSAWVEFADGFQIITSRAGLRRKP